MQKYIFFSRFQDSICSSFQKKQILLTEAPEHSPQPTADFYTLSRFPSFAGGPKNTLDG